MRHTFHVVLTVALVTGVSGRVWAQTAPPTLQKLSPTGAQRGTQVTVTIQGTNIGDATRLIFSEPGFSSRITAVEGSADGEDGRARKAWSAPTRRSTTRPASSS